MADALDFNNEQFFNYKHGGNPEDYEDNGEESDDEEIPKALGYGLEDNDFFAGGGKSVNERSFTVAGASVGSFEGGRFISTSAYNAAKKAATAVFRHVDVESGVTKPRKQAATTKNVKEITVNSTLASKYKRNPISEVEIILYRTDRQNAHKYYAYTAQRERAASPQKIMRTNAKGETVTVSFNYTIKVKPAELDQEYVEKNAQLSKEFNAAKRATKRRAANAGKEPKERKAPKAAAKAPKAAKAAKKLTVDDIIKSLTVKPSKAPKAAKAPKAPKAAKAAKAPKAAKAAKKAPKAPRKELFGGNGYCSFF